MHAAKSAASLGASISAKPHGCAVRAPRRHQHSRTQKFSSADRLARYIASSTTCMSWTASRTAPCCTAMLMLGLICRAGLSCVWSLATCCRRTVCFGYDCVNATARGLAAVPATPPSAPAGHYNSTLPCQVTAAAPRMRPLHPETDVPRACDAPGLGPQVRLEIGSSAHTAAGTPGGADSRWIRQRQQWQRYAEGAPSAQRALKVDASPHQFHQAPHDGQAQP